jgi:hypothetical protein
MLLTAAANTPASAQTLGRGFMLSTNPKEKKRLKLSRQVLRKLQNPTLHNQGLGRVRMVGYVKTELDNCYSFFCSEACSPGSNRCSVDSAIYCCE